MDSQILTLILVTPLVGALLVALVPNRGKLPAWVALATSLVTLLLTLQLPAHFHYGQPGFQFETDLAWIPSPNIHYHIAVDGLSLWLVVLTGLLAPIGVLASWRSTQNSIQQRAKLFYALFLLQQTAMFGVFLSLDLMLYYGFWELSLVPMAILIAMCGRTQSEPGGPSAALRFFLYTFLSSAPLLVALLWLYAHTRSFNFATLQTAIALGIFPAKTLCWLSLAFLLAFAVKVPVLGVHGWLPDVFAEAPVAMAMVVSGKLGLYSLLRFHVGLFPVEARQAAPWLMALAAIGILYGALLALVQKDIWRLLAYGTLSSLSFCVLGIYSFTLTGLDGGIYQTLNEGLLGAAMFVLFAHLQQRFGTGQLSHFGGLARKSPTLATLFTLTALALIGLPLLNGFVGEFLVLTGTFTGASRGWAVVGALGVIFSAAYMLTATQRIFLGSASALVANQPVGDLALPEQLVLWPLALLFLVMGVAPGLWLSAIEPAVRPATAPVAAHVIPACSAPGVVCRITILSLPAGGRQ